MDLKLFFNSVDENLAQKAFPNDSLFKFIYVNDHQMPDKDGLDIAIIGLNEIRGSESIKESGVDLIREKLYSLKKGSGACNIADLGNLRNGPTLEESYKRIQEVVYHLMEQNILPVLIGGSQDLDIGQFMAYEEMDKLVNILNIDARFDLLDDDNASPDVSHIHKILTYEPNYLFSYNHLAHQSYLVSPWATKVLEQLNFNAIRLGNVRENIMKTEPLIREADMITFDVSAIQEHYCKAGSRTEVFGLTGEEACQISWYAGMNDKLSSAGFYEYDPSRDTDRNSSASTIAVMVWYFIEGYKNRKHEKGFQTNDYTKYVVSMENTSESMVFYKSRLSEKWWMEIPNTSHKGIYDRNFIVPCDYDDYQIALKGELPDRWINTISKLS